MTAAKKPTKYTDWSAEDLKTIDPAWIPVKLLIKWTEKLEGKWPEEMLRSIDPETIPEDLLKSWWAYMNGKKSGPARLEKWREGLDPIEIEEREAQRKYRAERRARGLDGAKKKV